MACATLKRSLDWESLNQRPAKRRRCGIFPTTGTGSTQSPNTHPGTTKLTCEPTPSVFADATLTKLTPGMLSQSSKSIITVIHESHHRHHEKVFCVQKNKTNKNGNCGKF